MNIKSISLIPLLFFFINYAEAKFGLIETSEGPKFSYYEKINDHYLTEWDILVEPAKRRGQSDKANSRRFFGKWKEKTIPFVIDENIPNPERIQQAIDYFHANTSIRLVERTIERDYVYFKENGDNDCSSFVGRKGGRQNIHVPGWCTKGSLIHEILHALGFNHEQSRPDRRKYIRVHWTNIQLDKIGNFFPAPFARTYGPFDMNSIMLYPSFNGFAKDPTKPTMTLRDGTTFGSQRKGMSEQDLKALEEYYP